MNGISANVHTYATVELCCQFQKSIRGRVLRVSKTNSIKNAQAYSVGDITQYFINVRTPCSFSVFKQIYIDALCALSDAVLHKPYCTPDEPVMNVQDLMNASFSVCSLSFFGLCTALGIKSEKLRKQLLWTEKEERLRIIGNFSARPEDETCPAYIFLGNEVPSLTSLSDVENVDVRPMRKQISVARIQSTETNDDSSLLNI